MGIGEMITIDTKRLEMEREICEARVLLQAGGPWQQQLEAVLRAHRAAVLFMPGCTHAATAKALDIPAHTMSMFMRVSEWIADQGVWGCGSLRKAYDAVNRLTRDRDAMHTRNVLDSVALSGIGTTEARQYARIRDVLSRASAGLGQEFPDMKFNIVLSTIDGQQFGIWNGMPQPEAA